MNEKAPTPQTSDPELTNQESIERIILENMNEGVLTLECNGCIFTANSAAVRILGLDETDLKGRRFDSVFPDDHRNAEFHRIFGDAVEKGIPVHHREVVFRRADGQRVDLSVSASFIDVDVCLPDLQTFVVVFRDITAFKSLERMKRRAINHLSHELRTPLSVIQATVERLTDSEILHAKLAKKLDRIKRNTARLQAIREMVEEVLEQKEYRPRSFDVNDLVNRVLHDIRREASHRSVTLSADLEEVQTDLIDPDLLETALHTLVKNAIESSPDGAEVVVSFKSTEEGPTLVVQDHGVGIPVADHEFLFEGFHNTQPTDFYSTGHPFDFGAGGKGLELMRLKVRSETSPFKIRFESSRCCHIPASDDQCPGDIAECPHISDVEGCQRSGGSIFTVLFHNSVEG